MALSGEGVWVTGQIKRPIRELIFEQSCFSSLSERLTDCFLGLSRSVMVLKCLQGLLQIKPRMSLNIYGGLKKYFIQKM